MTTTPTREEPTMTTTTAQTTHDETCMCLKCCVTAMALVAAARYPNDPERQRELVEAYCRGLNQKYA